jgi:hypothetical protein
MKWKQLDLPVTNIRETLSLLCKEEERVYVAFSLHLIRFKRKVVSKNRKKKFFRVERGLIYWFLFVQTILRFWRDKEKSRKGIFRGKFYIVYLKARRKESSCLQLGQLPARVPFQWQRRESQVAPCKNDLFNQAIIAPDKVTRLRTNFTLPHSIFHCFDAWIDVFQLKAFWSCCGHVSRRHWTVNWINALTLKHW